MRPPKQPPHDRYHAHVYFDAATATEARNLTEALASHFDVRLGRLHEKPVGPHPRGSRQIVFGAGIYPELVEWLDAHRGALTVLVHSDTGEDLVDHTDHAWWLGEPETLDLDALKR